MEILAKAAKTILEQSLIEEAIKDREWPTSQDRELRILKYCIHYKVLALIADQYMIGPSREWEILEMTPRTKAAGKYKAITGEIQINNRETARKIHIRPSLKKVEAWV